MNVRFYGRGLEVALTLYESEMLEVESVIAVQRPYSSYNQAKAGGLFHEIHVDDHKEMVKPIMERETITEFWDESKPFEDSKQYYERV